MTCRETNALLPDYEDGALGFWTTLRVLLHLLFCPDCRAVLATLRALPRLVETLEPPPLAAEAALAGALARLKGTPGPRPWPASPVPAEAQELLEATPDLPLAILAAAHQTVARARTPEPGPYHLPQEILEQLPPEGQWHWVEAAGGRRVELLRDPVAGQKLFLSYAPSGAKVRAHRHLGSESILILAGSMQDGPVALTPGRWVHHPNGSVHAPEIRGEACWCLIREEGSTVAAGPLERLRLKVEG